MTALLTLNLTAAALAQNSFKYVHPAKCPGHKFAVTAFYPQLAINEEENLNLSFLVAPKICNPVQKEFSSYNRGTSDVIIVSNSKNSSLFKYNKTQKLNTAFTRDLNYLSQEELVELTAQIYEPMGMNIRSVISKVEKLLLLKWINLAVDSEPTENYEDNTLITLRDVNISMQLSDILSRQQYENYKNNRNSLVELELLFRVGSDYIPYHLQFSLNKKQGATGLNLKYKN